ncbi:unannotated protein [freshwater metagenome]|uniref:Unannotated protein n=1 Tax=freshwater metagenome TaxID=449393 RepID=A0A6J6H8J9_9ZZZZ
MDLLPLASAEKVLGNDACPRLEERRIARRVETIGCDGNTIPGPRVERRRRPTNRDVALCVFTNRGGVTADKGREPFTRCIGAVEVEARRQLRVFHRGKDGHQHGEEFIDAVYCGCVVESVNRVTCRVLCVPTMDLDLMGHSSLPKTIGEVFTAEIPRRAIGIACGKRGADRFKDLVESIEDGLVSGKAYKSILSRRRHHPVGDAEIGPLQHLAGVTEKTANGPARAMLDGCLKASSAGGCGKAHAFSAESCDVIHRVVLHGARPTGSRSCSWAEPNLANADTVTSMTTGGEPIGEKPRSPLCPHVIKRPVMTQVWRDVTFAHWPVPIAAVEALLPPGLDADTFHGQAWVSLVGFEMDALRLRGLPAIPTTHQFLEFNVRTYVVGPEGPGVWFCSLDVAQWLPALVARIGFALPYDKGAVEVSHDRSRIVWTVDRAWPERAQGSLAVSVETDDVAAVTDDALATFLTARWRLYAKTRGGRLVTAPVEHEPWPLTSARFIGADTGLASIAGFDVQGDPIVHHASAVRVRVGLPKLLPLRRARGPVTVWFDEDCGVCSASVRWLMKRTDSSVTFRPNRELDDTALLSASADAIVVTASGESWTAIEAVATILDRSGWLGRVGAFGLRLPGIHAVAGLVYRWVAANRARLSARLGLASGCDLPKSTS